MIAIPLLTLSGPWRRAVDAYCNGGSAFHGSHATWRLRFSAWKALIGSYGPDGD